VTWIQEPEDPQVAKFQMLKHKEERGATCIADHEKTVLRLLSSNWEVDSIFATPRYLKKHWESIRLRLDDPTKIFCAEESVFAETIGYALHRGFLATAKHPGFESHWEGPSIACQGIVDAENLGAIVRTGVAFGIRSFVLDKETTYPFLRRTIRVSMGNIFQAKFCQVENLAEEIRRRKKEREALAIGLSLPDPKFLSLGWEGWKFPEKGLLVVGNEANGISEETKKALDGLLSIPMSEGVDSLNVSHALAACLGRGWH